MTTRHRAAAAAVLAATLTLAACSDDSGNSGNSDDSTSSADSTGATETTTVTETETSAAPEGKITVSASGGGPIALTTEDTPPGDPYSTTGRLVVGEGGCFAMAEFGNRGGDNTPRPLVLPADAEFVTQNDRPAVTLPGQDTVYVGDALNVDVVSMQIPDLEQLPEACARGVSKTGLVVS